MEVSFFIFNFVVYNIKHMLNLYKTYNQAKDVFKKPKLKISFGLWKNMRGLPVWRCGNRIRLAKYSQYYNPNNIVHIKQYSAGDIKEDGSVVKYDMYRTSYHELPKHAKNGVWRRDIRQKLRKYKLGWIKPQYFLPLWLSFYVFNFDVIFKWKYDDICYEFPPQFTIVFFGFALHITLEPYLEDEYDDASHYWESLLSYLYHPECNKNITDTLLHCGCWHRFNDGVLNCQLRKKHINKKYHYEYDEAIKKLNNLQK